MTDQTSTATNTTTIAFDRETWSDFLNWGGITATAWQTTFDKFQQQLAAGLIPFQTRNAVAAQMFAQNYAYLAGRVWWMVPTVCVRKPLPKVFAPTIWPNNNAQEALNLIVNEDEQRFTKTAAK